MATTSLRRSLLARLMVPLVAVVLVAGGSAWALAQYFSQTVLDQWLYDSAVTLAKQVRFVSGRVELDIPGPAIEMFEADVMDRIFYDVETATGMRLFSNVAMPPPPTMPGEALQPVYYDTFVKDEPVRAIALVVTGNGKDPVLVKVAETRRKRDKLAIEVLLAALALVAVLVATAVALVWVGIGRSLSSLEPIVRRVGGDRRSLAPLPDGVGVPSEVRPLVRAINELLGRVSEEHAARQNFVANAAHQLRTPLASLRVQLDLALREQDPERRQRALAEAAAVLSRTGHLIHRLLTLARVDQDTKEGATETVDLDALARDEVEQWVDRALARGVELGYDNPGRPVPVLGREGLLREALSNLIDNAIAYAASGRHVTVGVHADPPQLFVEDEGPGIPAQERDRVRERFYRIPGTPGEGCGLGLAIVDEIARRHRARFLVLPREQGPGTRTVIDFQPGRAGATDGA